VPQGNARLLFSTAPRQPIAPRRMLQLVYAGPPIVKTPAERVLRIIRERCPELSDQDLALVLRPPALPPPQQSKVKAKRRARRDRLTDG
jgi:hypothetical protein